MAGQAKAVSARHRDYMEAEAEGLKPLATLKTRIIVEDTIPLIPARSGVTIGMMVDEHIDQLRQGEEVKKVLSITIELPSED